jgi:hypothetical protein
MSRSIFKRPHQNTTDRGRPANIHNERDHFLDDHMPLIRQGGIKSGQVNRFSRVLGEVEQSSTGKFFGGKGRVFEKEVEKKLGEAEFKAKKDFDSIQSAIGIAPKSLRKKIPLQNEITEQVKRTGELSTGLKQKIQAFLSK